MTFIKGRLPVERNTSKKLTPLFDTLSFETALTIGLIKHFNRGYMTHHLSTLDEIRLLMVNALAWKEKELKRSSGQKQRGALFPFFEAGWIDGLAAPMLVFEEEEREGQCVAVPHVFIPHGTFSLLLAESEGVTYADERATIQATEFVRNTGTVMGVEELFIKTPSVDVSQNVTTHYSETVTGKKGKKRVESHKTKHIQPGGRLLSGDRLVILADHFSMRGGQLVARRGLFSGGRLEISSILEANTTRVSQAQRLWMGARTTHTTETQTPVVGRALVAILEMDINTDIAVFEGVDVRAAVLRNNTQKGLFFGPKVKEMDYSVKHTEKSWTGGVTQETRGGQEVEVRTSFLLLRRTLL